MPLAQSPSPASTAMCPWQEPAAMVVHANNQGLRSYPCTSSWPQTLLSALAWHVYLQPTPATIQLPTAGPLSQVCVYHWRWPLLVFALVLNCWRMEQHLQPLKGPCSAHQVSSVDPNGLSQRATKPHLGLVSPSYLCTWFSAYFLAETSWSRRE